MYRRLGGKNGALSVQGIIWKRKRNSSIGNMIFLHHRILTAVRRGEIFSDRMSRIVLRSHWCNINFVIGLARSEEKSDGSKDSFMTN